MAVTLFKLAITADTTTTVTTKPDVKRYFYILNQDHITDDVLTIPANAFVDDAGDTVDEITEITPDNGYYMLFINGVLQQTSLYTVSSDEVVVQQADEIEADAPIILVVTNFSSEAESETTVNT